MALTSGFYNSNEAGDRKYDALDFAKYLTGIVHNGCFPDTGLQVMENPGGSGGPSVVIRAGKGYKNGLWLINDSDFVYSLGNQLLTPNYSHLIFVEFDVNFSVRAAKINHITGAAPVMPEDGGGKYYLPLAVVADQMSSQPTQANITDSRTFSGISIESNHIETHHFKGRPVTGDVIALRTILGGPDGNIALSTITGDNIANNSIGIEKMAYISVLPRVYLDDPGDSFKDIEAIGGEAHMLNYTATTSARMNISGYVVIQDSSVSEDRQPKLQLEWREKPVAGTTWSSWTVNSWTKQFINAGKYATLHILGVVSMTAGYAYQVRLRAESTENLHAERMLMSAVVGWK